jgi:hypothetical protein
MTDLETQPTRAMLLSTVAMIAAAFLALAGAGFGLYKFSSYINGKGEALALSLVVLVGLALIVALVAGLAIVYKILGVETKGQALALPEGSVRALIAFSLLLIFVCLATFIYEGTRDTDLVAAGKVTNVTQQAIDKLRENFIVVEEPAAKAESTPAPGSGGTPKPGTPAPGTPASGTPAPGTPAASAGGGTATSSTPASGTPAAPAGGGAATPLFNATYYTRPHSKDADDIGKQIFTTLATVFVSVVSFYFGSSTTNSNIGAAIKAAAGGDGKPSPDKPAPGNVPANAPKPPEGANPPPAGQGVPV